MVTPRAAVPALPETKLTMAHAIHGFIAPLDHLQQIAPTLPGARVCPLAHGLGFLPFAAEVSDPREPPSAAHETLHELPARLEAWALSHSTNTPITYIETSYHGGTGSQAAIVWHHGQITFGPDFYSDDADDYEPGPPGPSRALTDLPINRALRHLGVRCVPPALDEFDTLGLGRHRSSEDWYAQTFPPVT